MRDEKLTPRNKDFSEWYNQIILRAKLADYAPVRGCMVVRPYGWALWENIQQSLDKRFKETGHKNAAFPLFIPMSFLEKEKEHVKGFSPELAIVTIGGGEKLEEPLVVRPTSETIIGYMYSKWIQSYRDLPILINQWGNVVRWELRTRLFLRTLEFYWQEGHTAHSTEQEALEETRLMLDIYTHFALNEAAIPVIPGIKTDSEKFAGAIMSTTIETMTQDARALQSATSHFLGQNFAKAFNIQFLDEDNSLQYAWTTSWGLSTRFIGALIMTHGDDQGLILPPKLAPIQVILIPIYTSDVDLLKLNNIVEDIKQKLLKIGIRAEVDYRKELTPGFKFNEWELRGVPLRIEIGPRDIQNGSALLARRDIAGAHGKSHSSLENIEDVTEKLLSEIQYSLLQKATAYRDEHMFSPHDFLELSDAIQEGWSYSFWCGSPQCEKKVKEQTKATIRCVPFNSDNEKGKCIVCGEEAAKKAYFARAY